jgi:O-acetyl-ADP-ribose deacetylase (regulator of RNase III)
MKHVKIIQGDITTLEVDAIVNAANTSLLGGGGVDGAIHRVGGPQILEECKEIRNRQGGCDVGEAVITSGGNLKARFVIHTVGPVWKGGTKDEDKLLARAYYNSLKLAVKHGIKTIAFPNISTGAYGYPKGRAAEVATHSVNEFLKTDSSVDTVTFCCYDEENFKVYKSIIE